MQELYIESLGKILENRARLEKELDVKISNRGKNIFVDGDADKEFITIQVLEALNLGFSPDDAFLLKNENIILQKINIKEFTKRKDISQIKARLIGTQGKAKNNIENLSECIIAVHDNKVGIIGDSENIDEAMIAVRSLIQGSKHGNVYARLEKKKKEKRLAPKESIKNEFD